VDVWEYIVIAVVIACLAIHEAKRARFDFLLIPWWGIVRSKDYFGGTPFLTHYSWLLFKWVAISIFFSVFIPVLAFDAIVKTAELNMLFAGILVSILFYFFLLSHMREPAEKQNIKDIFSTMSSDRVEFIKQLIKLVLAIAPGVMRKFFQPLINADESIMHGCVELLYAEYDDADKINIIESINRDFLNNATDDSERLKEQVNGLKSKGITQQVLCILTEKVRRLGYTSAKVEIDRSLRMLAEDKREAVRQPIKGQAIQFDYQGKNHFGTIVECSSNGKGCYITTQANIPPGTPILFDCHGQMIEAKVMHRAPIVNQSAGIGIRVENGVNLAQMLMA